MSAKSTIGIEKRSNLAPIAILSLFFFSPVSAYLWIGISGGNTLLFEDGLIQSFPFRAFLHNAFANGFSPQWVPFSACGFSLLAEGQNGICFPGTQIIYRLFSAETGWMVELFAGRLAAFAFCWHYFQNLHVSRVGAFFGASVYAFCGGSFGIESVPAILWCYALLPAVLLSCDLFLERRPWSFAYLIISFALLFLTGHPVMIIYIGMMVFLYLLFQLADLCRSEKSIRKSGPLVLGVLGSVLVAVLIASPQLLPMLQMLPFSARTAGPGISLDVLQNTMHLQPGWLPQSLFPTPFHWGDEVRHWSNLVRFPLYALFLGCVGMLFRAGSLRRGFFIFFFLFTILMALGPYVGLWKLVHSFPVLEHFRYPFRWLFFLPICIAFFSARGMDHLLTCADGLLPVGLWRLVRIVVLTISAAAAMFLIRHHHTLLGLIKKAAAVSPWLTGLLWVCAIGMVIAAYLSLIKGSTRIGVMLGASLTVLSLFATIAFNIKDPLVIRNLDMIGWKGGNLPNGPSNYRTSSVFSPGEVFITNTVQRHYQYTPNLTVLNGTLTTGYYFSFLPYWSANISSWCQEALNGAQEKQIYLNLSSARWLFPRENSSFEESSFPTESYKGVKAYKNLAALPRVSVVSSGRLFPDENALMAFLESPGLFDPRKEMAVLRQDAAEWRFRFDEAALKVFANPPEARIVTERPDRIEIDIEPAPPEEAFLVLNDSYFPGWRALADGVEVKVVRANYAFRGIRLPEGTRRVVFFFDPLVPDAVLPLPTLLLAVLGGAVGLGQRFSSRRETKHARSLRLSVPK